MVGLLDCAPAFCYALSPAIFVDARCRVPSLLRACLPAPHPFSALAVGPDDELPDTDALSRALSEAHATYAALVREHEQLQAELDQRVCVAPSVDWLLVP